MLNKIEHVLKMLSTISTIFLLLLGFLILPQTLAVVPPSDDPFYDPPAGFASQAPGTVLRTRQVVTSFLGLIPDPVEAWQLLYRTTAINGSAIATATTVFKPVNAMTDRFVSFHTAYDGAAQSGICDPSYNYELGSPQVDLISSIEYLLLQAFIMDGYIVSSPDYEGPDSAFGAGRLEGMAVLDSMRAVSNFKDTLGLSTSTPKIVGYGYSGGAIATGWAASLHSNYASELNVLGWAQGGTPANLTGTAVYLEGTLFAGFVPQALVGLSTPSAYGAQLNPVIESIITPLGQSILDTSKQICGAENLLTFEFGRIESTSVQKLGDQIYYQPSVAAVLEQTTMGINANEIPTAPIYMYHATQDEIIPYANATTLDADWCGYGANVQFVTVANGGHASTEILGFPGAYNFVNAAFAGNVSKGCSQSTILDSTLDPVALGAELEPVLIQLLNALAVTGEKDINIINDLGTLNKTI